MASGSRQWDRPFDKSGGMKVPLEEGEEPEEVEDGEVVDQEGDGEDEDDEVHMVGESSSSPAKPPRPHHLSEAPPSPILGAPMSSQAPASPPKGASQDQAAPLHGQKHASQRLFDKGHISNLIQPRRPNLERKAFVRKDGPEATGPAHDDRGEGTSGTTADPAPQPRSLTIKGGAAIKSRAAQAEAEARLAFSPDEPHPTEDASYSAHRPPRPPGSPSRKQRAAAVSSKPPPVAVDPKDQEAVDELIRAGLGSSTNRTSTAGVAKLNAPLPRRNNSRTPPTDPPEAGGEHLPRDWADDRPEAEQRWRRDEGDWRRSGGHRRRDYDGRNHYWDGYDPREYRYPTDYDSRPPRHHQDQYDDRDGDRGRDSYRPSHTSHDGRPRSRSPVRRRRRDDDGPNRPPPRSSNAHRHESGRDRHRPHEDWYQEEPPSRRSGTPPMPEDLAPPNGTRDDRRSRSRSRDRREVDPHDPHFGPVKQNPAIRAMQDSNLRSESASPLPPLPPMPPVPPMPRTKRKAADAELLEDQSRYSPRMNGSSNSYLPRPGWSRDTGSSGHVPHGPPPPGYRPSDSMREEGEAMEWEREPPTSWAGATRTPEPRIVIPNYDVEESDKRPPSRSPSVENADGVRVARTLPMISVTEKPTWATAGVSHISEYELLAKLGEGTFGEVCKGIYWGPKWAKSRTRDLEREPRPEMRVKGGDKVALKRIITHNESDGMPITSLREIRLLKSLDHVNIVPVVDMAYAKGDSSIFQRGYTYMVFPYLEHDLAGLLENKSINLSVSQAKLFAQQLLRGTAYLHQHSILHRDMKAANLLIANDGTLKIADFGLARSMEPATVGRDYTAMVVTRWYRPPEILLGNRKYNLPADMWGVGCVIAEMFKKTPVFAGTSDINQCELIFRICGSPTEANMPGWQSLPGCEGVKRWKHSPRLVVDEYKRFGEHLADLLDKLLVLDPAQRLTAVQALDHEWFWTEPMPSKLAALQWADSHEYDRRKHDDLARNSQAQQLAAFTTVPPPSLQPAKPTPSRAPPPPRAVLPRPPPQGRPPHGPPWPGAPMVPPPGMQAMPPQMQMPMAGFHAGPPVYPPNGAPMNMNGGPGWLPHHPPAPPRGAQPRAPGGPPFPVPMPGQRANVHPQAGQPHRPRNSDVAMPGAKPGVPIPGSRLSVPMPGGGPGPSNVPMPGRPRNPTGAKRSNDFGTSRLASVSQDGLPPRVQGYDPTRESPMRGEAFAPSGFRDARPEDGWPDDRRPPGLSRPPPPRDRDRRRDNEPLNYG